MHLRLLLLAALAAVALACAAVAGAGAGASSGHVARRGVAFAGAGVIAAANALRARVGVAPLRAGSYDEIGGNGDWTVDPADGATPLEAMGTWPELLAVLFDPRTTVAATGPGDSGAVELALLSDTTLPLPRTILPLRLDPASPFAPAVLLATRPRSLQLFETRGGSELLLPLAVTRVQGVGGAWLAQLEGDDDGVRVGYASRYRLVVDGVSHPYVTAPLPQRFLTRSWSFGPTLSAADRRRYKAALATAPALARQLIATIDGAVRVERKACDDQDSSCAAFSEQGAYSISIAPADFEDSFDDLRFVTLHEFGHLVDYMAFDARSYAAFASLFLRSPRWQKCFPDDTSSTGCVELSEIIADQFAYWATGLRADPSGGYGDPPLVDPVAFETVLRQQWAFRPPLYRNPAVR